MSGHSKWHKIQHKKGKADAKRGASFTKLLKAVTIAAASGGGDPEMNFSLRLAVEKAKAGNVPKDNIERAIKRGTGELDDGVKLQEVLYEGRIGEPAFLVECVTDNTNRAVSEVKHIFSKHGGSLGGPGSVAWMFERFGVARIRNQKSGVNDELELALIDAGANDIKEEEDGVEILCPVDKLQSVVEALQSAGIEPDESGLEWIAKEKIEVGENDLKKVEILFEALDENDDVDAVYTNMK